MYAKIIEESVVDYAREKREGMGFRVDFSFFVKLAKFLLCIMRPSREICLTLLHQISFTLNSTVCDT